MEVGTASGQFTGWVDLDPFRSANQSDEFALWKAHFDSRCRFAGEYVLDVWQVFRAPSYSINMSSGAGVHSANPGDHQSSP